MLKKWFALLLIGMIASLALLACGNTGGNGGQAKAVHMTMLQTSITIKKGEYYSDERSIYATHYREWNVGVQYSEIGQGAGGTGGTKPAHRQPQFGNHRPLHHCRYLQILLGLVRWPHHYQCGKR
jgi:hypothetical protein